MVWHSWRDQRCTYAVPLSTDRDRVAARKALVRVINETFARAGLMAEAHSGALHRALLRLSTKTRLSAKTPLSSNPDRGRADVLLLPTLTLCAIAAKPLDGSNDEYKSHARVLAMDLVRQLLEGPIRGDVVVAVALAPSKAALRRRAQGGCGRGGSKRLGAGDRTRVFQGRGFKPRRERRGERSCGQGGQGARASAAGGAAFGAIVLRARKSYKREIAALCPALALALPSRTPRGVPRGAEGAAVDPDHQLVALRLVRKLASDPQVLVDVFVNYDCDLNGENLFEADDRRARGRDDAGEGSRQAVRNGALQCVLAMVQSLPRLARARGGCRR